MVSKRYRILRVTSPIRSFKGIYAFLVLVVIVLSSPSFRAQGQPDQIRTLAWSPDGGRLAIAGGDPSCDPSNLSSFAVQILDVPTQQIIHSLEHHNCAVETVRWSPYGTRLVSGGGDHQAVVWDVNTGDILAESSNYPFGVRSFDWSPDGTRIVAVPISTFLIVIWDANTGSSVLDIDISFSDPPTPGSHVVDWSPDGSKIIGDGGDSKNIYVWDANTGDLISSIEGHTDIVLALDWSPDSTRIASGAGKGDPSVRVWDAASGQSQLTLLGHTDTIYSVKWSPDGSRLASAGLDGTVRIWDATTGQELEVIQSMDDIHSVDWSPDGTQLAFDGADGSLEIVPAPQPPTADAGPDQTLTDSDDDAMQKPDTQAWIAEAASLLVAAYRDPAQLDGQVQTQGFLLCWRTCAPCRRCWTRPTTHWII